jgi:RimJ/RimL family protein N-acetyltransferase
VKNYRHNGVFAGLIGLINSSSQVLATEIGLVIILPPFHRTHVASNAVGLLLHYTLETSNLQAHASTSLQDTSETSSAFLDGPPHSNVFTMVNGRPLGLRRVVWQADARNAASIRLAERMGFKLEAVQRWGRILPVGRPVEIEVRIDDPKAGEGGLNAAMLSLCWDDWESGARDKVQVIMQRIN